jgi:diacylglycerol kinase family enzyme
MRVAAIINADGGTVRRAGPEAERERVAAAFAQHGLEGEIVLARGQDVTREAARALDLATAGGLDAVAVGGGDGTIGAVAGLASGTGVPLGILPLGTLNHCAKELEIPLALDEAAAVIAAGTTRDIDVGEVNGRVFVNNSSVGVYPYMVLERDRRMRGEGWGKWPAMTLAFLRMLRRFPRRRLYISAEGWAEPCRTPLVFIGNNEYEFGLLGLGKRARLDGGELSLYVARHRHPLALLGLVFRATFGRLDEAKDFTQHRAAAAEIRSRASRLPVTIDGEVVRLRPPLHYRIRPRALRVLGPRPNEAA